MFRKTTCFASIVGGACIFVMPLAAQNSYLALGDSIPFGLNPDPTVAIDLNNYHGYPQEVASRLQLSLTNGSCPWETSASMVSLTPGPFGCYPQWINPGYPTFVSFNGASQLDYAIGYLSSHRATKLVTINVGGNDLLPIFLQCGLDVTCAAPQLPGVVVKLAQDFNRILSSIRNQGHYSGPIVIVNYFAFNYRAPETAIFAGLNATMSAIGGLYGATTADVFAAFAQASQKQNGDTCKAGLRLPQIFPTDPYGCNAHPSAIGQDLIAKTVLAAVGKGD